VTRSADSACLFSRHALLYTFCAALDIFFSAACGMQALQE